MSLDRVIVEGFKSIERAELPLKPLNVFVGANGSGKSNLISVFGFARNLIEQRLQVTVAQQGGASALLRFGPKHTPQLRLKFDFAEPKNSYEALLTSAAGDALIFKSEKCWGRGSGHQRAFEVDLGAGHRESRLPDEVRAGKGAIARFVREAMTSWRVYHFHDTSPEAPVKQSADAQDNDSLRANASNLAPLLLRIREEKPEAYERIVGAIRLVTPFFADFSLRELGGRGPKKMLLEWKERGSDAYLSAHALSDGTLRFICLATLLQQPWLPSTVLLDEPELGLHPYAIVVLAGMLKAAATRTQLLIATQSVTLLNQFEPDEIVVVDRSEHGSMFRRFSQEEVDAWLDGYSVGEIWEKNLIGGRPA